MLEYDDAIVHRWKFTVGIICCNAMVAYLESAWLSQGSFRLLDCLEMMEYIQGGNFKEVGCCSLVRKVLKFWSEDYVWQKMHTNFRSDNLLLDITLTWLSMLVLMTIIGFMDGDHVIWSKSIRRIRIPDSKLLFDLHVFCPFWINPNLAIEISSSSKNIKKV